jgi:hypothetical protein
LPQQWIGKQAYAVKIVDREKNAIVMVPFADAGQTGGDIKVWIPMNIANK